jgi:hypothetical protein
MTTYERLTMAIDRINAKGWTAGSMTNERGEGCLVRSLVKDGELVNWNEAVIVACKALGFADANDAISWNDKRVQELIIMSRMELLYSYSPFSAVTIHDPVADIYYVKRITFVRTKAEVLARLEAARDAILNAEIDKAVHAESAVSGPLPTGRLIVAELEMAVA